ncbi:MAG: FAD-dependent oxidoreductase [Neisseriaceae bacterium]|nr:FAD-dependent oxidoreductase [Neisseriaceae bacterium]
MAQISILGGGLTGRLMALLLARQGHCIQLYEQGGKDGNLSAAFVAAAMLAPMAEAVDATPLVLQLGYQSLDLWKQIMPMLPEKVFMQFSGSLIVWHAQDGDISHRFAQQLRRGNGGKEVWQNWNADDIATNEPQLGGRFTSGFYLPTEGQLDNRQTLMALANAIEEVGVKCHWNTAVSLTDITADWLIDCRGFGAKTDWNTGKSQLRGIRGEVARVYAPEITLNRPTRLLHPRYPLYIAPKENHIFVIGATQIESEDESPVSVRSGLELMSSLYAVTPAFGEARILELATNLRPTIDHHDPEIRVDTHKKILSINGLFRHGFMIAPAVCFAASRILNNALNNQVIEKDKETGITPVIL